MLIVGAKGFAKEVLQVFHELNQTSRIVFYDDSSYELPSLIYNQFRILKTINEAKEHFLIDPKFTLGVGNPLIRFKLYSKMNLVGGYMTSIISPKSNIGNFDVVIEDGVNIMTGVTITNSIHIKRGVLINLHCTIGHDSEIGEFTELSPGVHISGNCNIGNFCNIGTNATILPKLKIGNNVVVGAGAVVTKDIPDNSLVIGVPGKIIKTLPDLIFN